MSPPKSSQIEAIRELLPWYATGALGRQKTKAVEQALTEEPELAYHFELIREEMAETIHCNELLGAPSAQAFERLITSLDSEPRVSRRLSRNPISRIAEVLSGFSARSLSWAASAATVVLVIQAGVIAKLVSTNYSDERVSSVRGVDLTGGTYVLIHFKASATASEITRFLEANRLSVVDGPIGAAAFRVKLADTQLPKSELDQRVRSLQQASIIAGVLAVN